MKDMTKNSYVSLLKAVVLIIAGLILLVYPGAVLTTVVKIFGAGILAYGIFTGVSQLLARDERQPGALAASVIAVIVGLVVFFAPKFVSGIFPVVGGVIIIVGGAKRFWDALAARNLGGQYWWLSMLLAVVCVALGILIIVNPFGAAMGYVRLLGIAGIYYGVTGLIRLLRK